MRILAVPYALALVAAAGLCQLLPATLRPLVLALLSVSVYALFGGWQALLIVGLLLAVFGLAQAIARTARTSQTSLWPRLLTGLGVALCVGCWPLLVRRLPGTSLPRSPGSRAPSRRRAPGEPTSAAIRGLAVPLGISFFTFEFVHFLVDVYRRQISLLPPDAPPPQRRAEFVHFAAFALFFPTLLAGPIKRYQTFAAGGPASREDLAYGLQAHAHRAVQKLILADSVAPFALRLWVPDQRALLACGWRCTPTQRRSISIFSGYSDLAIGAGRPRLSRARKLRLAPIWPLTCRRSGDAGTSRYRAGSATICTSRLAAIAAGRPASARTDRRHGAVRAVAWAGLALRGVGAVAWAGLAVTRLWRGAIAERRTARRTVAPASARGSLGDFSLCLLRLAVVCRAQRRDRAALPAANAAPGVVIPMSRPSV